MAAALLTTHHKMLNRYLLTQGCVREQDLDEEYKQICNVYGEPRFRIRQNKTSLEQIIDDINRFMQFMNASIVVFDYELNDTKYYAYQLAVDTKHSSSDDLITKYSINLPLNQLKLFRKILDLALMNNGLITRKAINKLNDKLSLSISTTITITNDSSNNNNNNNNLEIINNQQLQELIQFVCKRKYLYKLSSNDDDDDEYNEDEDNYCIGPRCCVGLQIYIEKKADDNESLIKNCPICFDTIIGYGFQCPYRNCLNGVYHSKCVESLKQSRKCANCQKKWKFDPTVRIGLLSNPEKSENMIQQLLIQKKQKKKKTNHNKNRYSDQDEKEAMDEDDDDD